MMYCMPFPSSKSGNISFCFKRNWLEDISSGTVYAKERARERERKRKLYFFWCFRETFILWLTWLCPFGPTQASPGSPGRPPVNHNELDSDWTTHLQVSDWTACRDETELRFIQGLSRCVTALRGKQITHVGIDPVTSPPVLLWIHESQVLHKSLYSFLLKNSPGLL